MENLKEKTPNMRYIWEENKGVIHIMKYSPTGEMTFKSLCGIQHNFNRAINTPFASGRKVCKRCEKLRRKSWREGSDLKPRHCRQIKTWLLREMHKRFFYFRR